MGILQRTSASENNNSVLYLALLCLLYLLVTSNYLPTSFNSKSLVDTDETIFVEISKDGIATVEGFENAQVLNELKSKYGLHQDLKSGDKITIKENETLVSLRDSLLPKLLSGQLRIPDAEKLVTDAI